jgi:hypothetical protein
MALPTIACMQNALVDFMQGLPSRQNGLYATIALLQKLPLCNSRLYAKIACVQELPVCKNGLHATIAFPPSAFMQKAALQKCKKVYMKYGLYVKCAQMVGRRCEEILQTFPLHL